MRRYGVNLQFLRILKMLLWLMYLTHLLGCAWYAVSTMSARWGAETYWLAEYNGGAALTR